MQQKGVVPIVGFDLDKADIRGGGVQCLHQFSAFRGREQPVASKGYNAEARMSALERARQRPSVLDRKIEVIHRSGDIEIRVRVEAVDKSAALVAQIALDLEIGVEAVSDGVAILQIAPKLAVKRGLRKIGDVGGHAGHRQAANRPSAKAQVTPTGPIR